VAPIDEAVFSPSPSFVVIALCQFCSAVLVFIPYNFPIKEGKTCQSERQKSASSAFLFKIASNQLGNKEKGSYNRENKTKQNPKQISKKLNPFISFNRLESKRI
jgi:hypothetical protein